ncbi:MAG: DUF4124 domain-containing protein [Gallionella sp.]|nr:DUF4124 domain-containing protein [Gallionella sp.]
MKISNSSQSISSVCLILLFVSSTSHAEIYKWVDANGQTHYSEKKGDAGKAKAVELKVEAQPVSTQAPNSSIQDWQKQERQLKQRQEQKLAEKPYKAPVNTRPKSLSGGRADGTDASQCNLAQDVISGAVRHPNGEPTDKYDREVAENDIRAFCR